MFSSIDTGESQHGDAEQTFGLHTGLMFETTATMSDVYTCKLVQLFSSTTDEISRATARNTQRARYRTCVVVASERLLFQLHPNC